MRVNYRSTAELSRAVRKLGRRLPKHLDVVVGVSPGGLLAASMLALQLDLPLTDVDGLIVGRLITTGSRTPSAGYGLLDGERRVLLVDDSIVTGADADEAKARLVDARVSHEVSAAAIFVRPGLENRVDFVGERLESPTVFEWNVLQHEILKTSCVDIDGVLCDDPESAQDDDGLLYLEFLDNARPHLRPIGEIGWLVTSRLEKYREQTERWLEANGIRYRELVMLDHESQLSRRDFRIASPFKASIYTEVQANLFFESSIKQAAEIAHLAQRDVFCTDIMEMVRFDDRPTAVVLPPPREIAAAHRDVRSPVRRLVPRRIYRELARAKRRYQGSC